MSPCPIALRAAGAATLLVLAPAAGSAGSAAYAQDGDGVKVTVTPATAAPGTDVDIRVQGCKSTSGSAQSPAFVADVELTGRDGADFPLFGDTTVKSGLKDGAFKVSVSCDGREHRAAGTFTVGRHHQPTQKPTPKPTHQPSHKPSHKPTREPTREPSREATREPTREASPVAPVRAGGGGTAAFAVPAAPGVAQTVNENGLGTTYTLVGLGLAALAAVAVAFRSARSARSARRGTD